MVTSRFFTAFGPVLLLAIAPAVRGAIAEEPYTSPTDVEIEAAIAQLQDKNTRLAALDKLIPLCGYGVAPAQPFQRREIGKRAVAAVAACRNVETIGIALHSDNVRVYRWALHYFPWYPADDHPDVDPQRWWDLLPRVRQLALGPDSTARWHAQGVLRHSPGQREFLAELVKTETSASNVMRILRYLNQKTYRKEMDKHVLRILFDEDEEVRRSVMLFIGSNSNNAPMWQCDYSDAVCGQVLALSYSRSAKERAAAVFALEDLPDYDPERVRPRLFELARDTAENVRWRVPFAIRSQVARGDVQEVLARLLEDPSPLVRYFTILTLGPEKHEDKLRHLAAGPDKRVAEFAAGQLKQLAKKR